MTGQGDSEAVKSKIILWVLGLIIPNSWLSCDDSVPGKISTISKLSKVCKIPFDSLGESASLRIPRNGGTGSISGVGVLLWPGKPILCSRWLFEVGLCRVREG